MNLAPITTAADGIHKYVFIVFFFKKIRPDVSSESSQAVFSSKDKIKKLKCRLLQFLFGALRVNCVVKYRKHFMNCYYYNWCHYHYHFI